VAHAQISMVDSYGRSRPPCRPRNFRTNPGGRRCATTSPKAARPF